MAESWRGNPKTTTRKELWKILELINCDKNDIFCDLGCGHANLLRWSIQKVKYAIGTEDHEKRFKKAIKETKKYTKIKIFNEDYHYKKTLRKLRNATIFYTTNEISLGFCYELQNTLNHKAFLVTYCPPPYPIKADSYNGLHYSMNIPFTITKNKNEWLRSITKNGSLNDFKKRFIKEFEKYGDEYAKERYVEEVLNIEQGILGIDWIKKKHR
jgi:hypothetical protein